MTTRSPGQRGASSAAARSSTSKRFCTRSAPTLPTTGAWLAMPSSARTSRPGRRGAPVDPVGHEADGLGRHPLALDHATAILLRAGDDDIAAGGDQAPVDEPAHAPAGERPAVLVRDDDRDAREPAEHDGPDVRAEHVAVDDLHPAAAQQRHERGPRPQVPRAAPAQSQEPHSGRLSACAQPVRQIARRGVAGIRPARHAQRARKALRIQTRRDLGGQALGAPVHEAVDERHHAKATVRREVSRSVVSRAGDLETGHIGPVEHLR